MKRSAASPDGDRYFGDFRVGETFVSPEWTLSTEECLAFARSYDPQPFHLDEPAARASLFGRISTSGWHTAAVAMRLIVDSGFLRGPGVLGVGVDELRWLVPVYPGDTLHVEGEIVELVPHQGGKARGRMRVLMQTRNQDGTVVMRYIANLSVGARPA